MAGIFSIIIPENSTAPHAGKAISYHSWTNVVDEWMFLDDLKKIIE